MRILITGGSGLVGYALKEISKNYKHEFIFSDSKQCDLLDYENTFNHFKEVKPDFIIHLAAMVGGLFKNMKYPVEMYENNVIMNLNVLKASHKNNIQNIISCLSTCIFPDDTTYPINEEMLHDGPPHETNFAYAYAKRMLEVQSKAYRKQYNRNYICVIPTNIYGPHDNFSLEDGHVIPSLIHKCYINKLNNQNFEVRGTGEPLRQFIYSEDLAELILWGMENYRGDNIILSVPEENEISIRKVSEIIAVNFDYKDNICFNKNYSDGQLKKTADNKKLVRLNKDFRFTNVEDGIKKTVKWFLENYDSCRK